MKIAAKKKRIILHGCTTMSNARELALIEKWADIATPPTPTLPGLSPTSPRTIIKFCCCPQRRRYTLKQPKLKSTANTLHARNIFVDSDFTYIDDVPRASRSNNGNGIGNSSSSNKRRDEDCDSDYDCNDYDDEANDIAEISGKSNSDHDGNVALILMNQRNVPEQWRQDYKGDTSNSNSSSSNNKRSSELAAATAIHKRPAEWQ
ncbi:exonuclease 1-like [Drosophila navojoa]|uniref:exonuclease 1-like n=1 Tax=Drosophila navojoa TaxID=7232 RepID=UPI000846CC16|nr:exonuclease 1-like [Drosophila navojoa]